MKMGSALEVYTYFSVYFKSFVLNPEQTAF
jgi:hypothetical protein